jgi:hypothetical protein
LPLIELIKRLRIFPENEEHMIPSIRTWERKIFETRGLVLKEDLVKIFEKLSEENKNKDDSSDEKK